MNPQLLMEKALEEAARAADQGEVPVGAVLISADGAELSSAHNLVETNFDPTAHAEILCIREATKKLGEWRLTGSKLFVTLEPCPMCMTALSLARVSEVYYGSADPRLGAAGTLFDLSQHPHFPQKVKVFSGVLEERCTSLLKTFFQKVRA